MSNEKAPNSKMRDILFPSMREWSAASQRKISIITKNSREVNVQVKCDLFTEDMGDDIKIRSVCTVVLTVEKRNTIECGYAREYVQEEAELNSIQYYQSEEQRCSDMTMKLEKESTDVYERSFEWIGIISKRRLAFE